MRDYRDKLRDLLDEVNGREGITRYRIAKLSGISEQTLSNVMHKRRNLSIDALQTLLESLGYELQFLRSTEAVPQEQPRQHTGPGGQESQA